MSKRKSMFDSLNLEDNPHVAEMVDRLLAEGGNPDEIASKVADMIPAACTESGKVLFERLKHDATEMLADRKAILDGFLRRLHERWQRPFDSLKTLIESCRETGEEYARHFRPEPGKRGAVLFDCLVRLHARACLLTEEALWMMRGGFASGAQSRWRTLHEVTVVAHFISQHGERVAERYISHYKVDSYRAALQYQEHCAALGRSALAPMEVENLKDARDQLCLKYGKPYGEEWGWAAEALSKDRPAFIDIEQAIGMSHMRPYFKLACVSSHASSKGLFFDLGNALLTDAGFMLAGASNAGFFDPGSCTAQSILQVTCTLLIHRGKNMRVATCVMLAALLNLTEETVQAFSDAEDALEKEMGCTDPEQNVTKSDEGIPG
jgi:hypothetical protein